MSGLGRVGGGAGAGLASDFEHHHHVVHLGLGRASWQGAQGHCPTISTASLPVLARRFRADPHVCGGTVSDLRPARQRYGLSPRVRGNQRDEPERPNRYRSIPACAGEP